MEQKVDTRKVQEAVHALAEEIQVVRIGVTEGVARQTGHPKGRCE